MIYSLSKPIPFAPPKHVMYKHIDNFACEVMPAIGWNLKIETFLKTWVCICNEAKIVDLFSDHNLI